MNRYTWKLGFIEALMVLVALAFAFPLYILVNLSLKAENEQGQPLAISQNPTLQNYVDAWERANLGEALWYSFLIASLSLIGIVFVSALAAYPLVRLTSRLSSFSYWFILAGLLVPFQVALIPLYQTIRDIGLLGSVWSLVLFYTGLQVPFSTFLYVGFLRALPKEYEEAAWVDGASKTKAYWLVVFPMLRPVTGTVVILNAIFIWNDFLTPLLYLSGTGNVTIPVALFRFVGQYVSSWPLVFAGLVIGILPILLAYFLLQKTIIKGFSGGLKA